MGKVTLAVSAAKLTGTDGETYSCGLYQIDFVMPETDPETLLKQLDDFYLGLSKGGSPYGMFLQEEAPQIKTYCNEAWLTIDSTVRIWQMV